MKSIFHSSQSRGHAEHGWLNSYHSFSFAEYHDPHRMPFGALRVLNDDHVSGGMGFSKHPHNNMEIVSIPLEGELEHQDSMGNSTIIRPGEVQVMSAGIGVEHSEKNKNRSMPVKFLQIWIFPKEQNIAPNYDQKAFYPSDRQNQFQLLVSPNNSDDEGVKINQTSWFSMADISKGNEVEYRVHRKGNGTYFFLLEGEIEINNQVLKRRDALGLWEFDSTKISSKENSNLLAIEVPMQF